MNSDTVQLSCRSRQARRRFPSQLEFTAIRYGADTLMDSAAWALRSRPQVLRCMRRKYVRFCVELLHAIGRASRMSNEAPDGRRQRE